MAHTKQRWLESNDHGKELFVDNLLALNKELLEALKFALPFCPLPKGTEPTTYTEAYNNAQDAIQKAEGS